MRFVSVMLVPGLLLAAAAEVVAYLLVGPKRAGDVDDSLHCRPLARIWKDVLRTERVAATDNFFEVGGRSLLSMVVVARIQEETGVRVDLRDLLLMSLEQVAAKLDSRATASA